MKKVLLTGITGFLASHIAIELLKKGYFVRGSMRNLDRAPALKDLISQHVSTQALEFVQAELLQPEDWGPAVDGVDFLIHSASPVPKSQPDDENEVIVPAKEGTENVLGAAIAAGVKKIVLTSSVAAVGYGAGKTEGNFTEDDWTDPTNKKDTTPYLRSKALAEKRAWELCEDAKVPMAAINPSVIFGPALERDYGSSLVILKRMMNGKMPGLPKVNINIVDVRDVAELHILALESEAANGHRFIAASENMWLKEIADVLLEEYPDLKGKVTQKVLPTWFVKLYSLIDKQVGSIKNELGRKRHFDHSKATNVLGWKPRTGKECIIAGAESLKKVGAL